MAIAIAFASCSKDGATGPQGPAGTNGTSGLTVTNIAVTPGDWSVSSSTLWYYNASFGVNTTDACIVYFSTNNSTFFGMPTSNVFYSGDELVYDYATGKDVQIDYSNSGGEAIASTLYFNVIDVPPAINVKYPNTNWNDYTQVKAIIDLENATHK